MITSAVVVRGNKGVTGTLTANAGDVRLCAIIDNAAFGNGSTVDIENFFLSLEKPGSFIVDYKFPNQDLRFQFMNTINLLQKQINWTYTHSRSDNRTILDAALVLHPANKLSASYKLGSKDCKLKYSYMYRGVTALEPSYDFANNSLDVAVSHKIASDVIRVSYENVNKNLGVEWLLKTLLNQEGGIKISASFNLAEGLHMPKLSAETSWNLDM